MAGRVLLTSSAVLLAILGNGACFNPDDNPAGDSAEVDTDSDSTSSSTAGDDPSTATAPTSSTNPNPTAGADTSSTSTSVDTSMTGMTTESDGDRCGDGDVTGDEVCDDGVNDGSYGGCASDCRSLGPYCGDGRPNGSEACDDGNRNTGDGCNPDCSAPGSEVWCQLNGGDGGFDSGQDVTVGPDDQVIATGQVRPDDGSDARLAWVQMRSDDGTLEWTRTWSPGPGRFATGRGIASSEDQIVVTGGTSIDPDNPTIAEIFVNGYSLFGELSWERSGPRGDGQDIAMDGMGNAFVVGTFNPAGGNRDIWVRRYSVTGDAEWTDVVDVDAGSDDLGIAADIRDGTLAVGGRTNFASPWAASYDLDGNSAWAGGDAIVQTAEAVMIDPAGDVVLAARGGSFGEDVPSLWLRKFNDVGNGQWTQTADDIQLSGACVDSMGHIVVTGSDRLRKYDSMGEELWTIDIDVGTDPSANSCAVDSLDNIVVVGTVAGPPRDIFVCKYAP